MGFMKVKSLLIVLVMVAVSIVFFGCQKNSDSGKKVIYMLGMENQYDVWLAMKAAGIARGAESGYEVIYQAAPGGEADVQGQIALVETSIEAKPAAIVISPNDRDGLTDVCGKVKAAGIPLVLFISSIANNDYDAFVAFDNYLAARDVAKVICDELGGSGKVGFIGAVTGSSTLSNREAGYREMIAEEYPNIEFVGGALYSNNDAQRAMNATYDLLLAHPEIQAILTVNTATEEGICTALIELGREDVLVGGFDPSAAVIEYIAQGVMNALSCFDATRLGRTAVDVAIQLAEGKTSIEGLDENRFFNVAPEVVTPQNYLTEHSQSLLYPNGK
jgi:ribose transport system substrate-binding protein